MLKFFRSKHSQYFVFAILALLFLSFLFYSNAGSNLLSSGEHQVHYGKIDGQEVAAIDYNDAKTGAELASNFDGRADLSEVWVDLVIQKEAQKLNISVPEDAIIQMVHEAPMFLDDKGVYDPAKFSLFVAERLQPQGLSEDDFTQALNKKLVFDATAKALFGSVHAPVSDIEHSFKHLFGPVALTVWHFNPVAFEKDIAVSPADAQAEYKAHPENPAYREDEKREVEYVVFRNPAGQSNNAALNQAAGDFWNSFQPVPGTNFVPPTFEAEVQQFSKYLLQVQSSGLITAKMPAQGLPPSPHFNNAAFRLTTDAPISPPVQVADGIAVLHLVKIVPGPLKDFNSVQPAIISSIQSEKAKTALFEAEAKLSAGKFTPADLQALVASGKISETKVPAFDPVKAPTSISQAISQKLESLEDNQVSDAFSEDETSESAPAKPSLPLTIIRVDSRQAVSAEDREKYFTRYTKNQDSQYQNKALYDWVVWKSEQPGTEPPLDSPFVKTTPNS